MGKFMPGFKESLKTATMTVNESMTYAKKYAPRYFTFQKEWVKLANFLDKRF